MAMAMDLTSKAEMSWSDHLALKAQQGILIPSCLGSELIYVCLLRLMDPVRFQNALWNPVPSGNLLDELVEDWKYCLSEAIDEVAAQHLGMQGAEAQALRQLERIWQHSHNETARASYRMLLKTCEMAVKTIIKREFFSVFI